MLLKNISQKIIHVGSVMILPDETRSVDDSLSAAPSVSALIARGALSVVTASSQSKALDEDKTPAEPKGSAGESDSKKPSSRTGKGEKPSHE